MIGAHILEDDLVVVRPQQTAEDGEIVVARFEGNATVKALQSWNAQNRTNETTVADSTERDGAFVTKTFTNDENIPLVKYTVVEDTPHVYLQEESVSIWNEFFSKYSRAADGTLYYQADADSTPVAVTADTYQASSSWYTAE